MPENVDPSETKPALEWMCERYPDSPRKRIKEWFTKGRVVYDGAILKKPHERMVDPGERLSMGDAPPPVFFRRMPTRVHALVNLLYIDDAVAIVNKGPGILSVPAPGGPEHSALSVLDAFIRGKGGDELNRAPVPRKHLTPLPVHRLDQYTSGILCFAMNPMAREHLIRQIRDHSFIREYQALGDGKLAKARGVWRSWFQLDEEGMHQTVFDQPEPGATEAVSRYEVMTEISWPTANKGERHVVSKLKLRLESGLKHQLRIHAARAGVPLLGDRFYHPDYVAAIRDKKGMPYGCQRQALHASSLGFIHPKTGKTRRFTCKFPKDLVAIENHLCEKRK